MDQVVSNGELTEQIDNEQINTLDEQNESSLLINNPKTDTNKINVSSMEPFLSLDENLTTNIINDLSNIEAKKLNPDDELSNDNNQTEEAKLNAETIKSNLSLNLNESELPKNKKFLESSDDQIINQIFFQTITNTPTIDEGFPEIAFTELGTKAEEDDSTYTDTVDNYQDNEPNLCSLNDNFDENYCSFNSTERQPLNQPTDVDFAPYDLEASNPAEYENRLFAMEQLKNQRPSIVIDCYEDDEEEQEGTSETVKEPLEAKVENYCFYFDQTIEEDDEDVIDINGSSYGNVEDIDTVLDNNLTNVNNLIDDEDQSVSEDELTDDDVNSRIKVLNENCMSVHVSNSN